MLVFHALLIYGIIWEFFLADKMIYYWYFISRSFCLRVAMVDLEAEALRDMIENSTS